MSKPRHTVRLVLDVNFEGDYYTPDELASLCEGWIDHGFCDRDNLTGWTLVSSETTGSQPPEPRLSAPGQEIEPR